MTIDLPKELATAVQEGRAVLFLGAGASRGAMDDKLQPIPDGSGLAKILIKEFLGDDYDGLDLRSVYDCIRFSVLGARRTDSSTKNLRYSESIPAGGLPSPNSDFRLGRHRYYKL
jgi:hypothetical protein